MKKLLPILLLILCVPKAFGAWGDDTLVNRSSWTATSDVLGTIASTTIRGGVFMGVIIGSPSASESITIWDSIGVKTSTLAVLNFAGAGNGPYNIPFEIRISSGLTYSITGNTISGVTFIYKITRPQ